MLIKGYVLMFTLYDGMSRGICSGHRFRGIQEKDGGGSRVKLFFLYICNKYRVTQYSVNLQYVVHY